MNVTPGTTSKSLIVFIGDDAGLPVTGLVAATMPDVFYSIDGAAAVQIVLSDLASLSAAYSSGGVYEIGRGRYRLDAPNAMLASAAHSIDLSGEASGKHLIHVGGSIQTSPVPATDRYGVDVATQSFVQTVLDYINGEDSESDLARVGSAMTLTSEQVTALVAAIEAEIADDATGQAIKQAIVAKLLENLPDLDDLTVAAIASAAATATRDAILNRVLAGNHDTTGSVGKLLQGIGNDTAGTTTLLSRIPGTVQPQTGDAFARIGVNGAGLTDVLTAIAGVEAASGGLTADQAAQLAAIKAKTDTIGAASITVQSPVATNGTASIIRGDDYAGARVLRFVYAGYSGPSLSGATATFRAMPTEDFDAAADDATLAKTASSVTVNGSTVTIDFELADTDTATLSIDPTEGQYNYRYQVRATTTGGLKITIGDGAMTIARDI
jgi:hypothetical protein